MKQLSLSLVLVLLAAAVAVACTPAAPPPAPTAAPAQPKAAEPTRATAPAAAPTAAPTRATEPTKAPASQPTAAPAAAAKYPTAGKGVTIIFPFAAGSTSDAAWRLMAQNLEREFGAPFQVLNRPGAGTQIAMTELAKAKPDGYTIGSISLPTIIPSYLDPSRKAEYGRKDFQTIAMFYSLLTAVSVPTGSPYKTMKDLADAAKANPEKIKVGAYGIGTTGHLALLQFEKAAGVKFATVQFDGVAPGMAAMLGGHIDVMFGTTGEVNMVKAGQTRMLGIAGKEQTDLAPGVPTMESQGYKVFTSVYTLMGAPTGIPRDIVNSLSAAVRKITRGKEFADKMAEMGFTQPYMDPEETANWWTTMEADLKPFIEEIVNVKK